VTATPDLERCAVCGCDYREHHDRDLHDDEQDDDR
jgi:hypothetical protein